MTHDHPSMIQKKVCMLGAFAVGKTSLVSRFVKSIFSEKYHTTVGVKIDKKLVDVSGQNVNLILWDLHGEDEFQKVRTSYLRGSSGYILVADGTRRVTLDTVLSLHQRARDTIGQVPFLLILNKSDLKAEWEIDPSATDGLKDQGWMIIEASAKENDGVEEAFLQLAEMMTEV